QQCLFLDAVEFGLLLGRQLDVLGMVEEVARRPDVVNMGRPRETGEGCRHLHLAHALHPLHVSLAHVTHPHHPHHLHHVPVHAHAHRIATHALFLAAHAPHHHVHHAAHAWHAVAHLPLAHLHTAWVGWLPLMLLFQGSFELGDLGLEFAELLGQILVGVCRPARVLVLGGVRCFVLGGAGRRPGQTDGQRTKYQ